MTVAGLSTSSLLTPRVVPGSWCGTPGAHRAQDIVIATKPAR